MLMDDDKKNKIIAIGVIIIIAVVLLYLGHIIINGELLPPCFNDIIPKDIKDCFSS